VKNRFLRIFWKALLRNNIPRSKKLDSQIEEMYLSLREKNTTRTENRTYDWHRDICCIMLAVYRTLNSTSISRDTLLDALQEALTTPNSHFIKFAVRTKLLFSRDPMHTLVEYNKTRIPLFYGNEFDYVEEGDSTVQYTMRITRCFYHNFFANNAAPELTALFCEWDKNWMNSISPLKHGVRVERKTTIGTGGESCPFTFIRTE